MRRPLNRYIDHTLLRPDATTDDIRRLVDEALQNDFAAVCVNGCYVAAVAEHMAARGAGNDAKQETTVDTGTGIAAVVGFPLGASSTDSKIEEARIAINDGALEIDMVINIGAVKDGRWDYVRNEIYNLAQICHRSGRQRALLKVILETCLLTDEEIRKSCRICVLAGADYVKTSTGFSDGGATVNHVRLMKESISDPVRIKASGGIRTLADAKAMIDAGADRLGCSSSLAIMDEYRNADR